jgi:hypothetical protein
MGEDKICSEGKHQGQLSILRTKGINTQEFNPYNP